MTASYNFPSGRLIPTATPGMGDLALILRQSLLEPGPAEALGLGLGTPGDVDQHFVLIDHVMEFEADAILARPGDARRNHGRAADENDLGADRRHLRAFDQRALARQVAQARVDLAERRLQFGREQHARPLRRALAAGGRVLKILYAHFFIPAGPDLAYPRVR